MTVVAQSKTAVADATPTTAVAAASVPSVPNDTNEMVLSERTLSRTGQIIGIASALVALLVLPIGGFYVAQQRQSAVYDTLIQERGARNLETRQMVVDLQRDFQIEKTTNAGFRERMDQRTNDILQMLRDEREDRKEIKPR